MSLCALQEAGTEEEGVSKRSATGKGPRKDNGKETGRVQGLPRHWSQSEFTDEELLNQSGPFAETVSRAGPALVPRMLSLGRGQPWAACPSTDTAEGPSAVLLRQIRAAGLLAPQVAPARYLPCPL